MLPEIRRMTDIELAEQALELGKRAQEKLATINDPKEAVEFTHNVKAIRDRISKVQMDQEQAFRALFPWSIAWLDGMRQTGRLIGEGQETGAIQTQSDGGQPSNRLLLGDLGLDKMQSSRWQRLAQIDDQDFDLWKEERLNNREQPTFSRLMSLWKLLFKDPEWTPLPEGTFTVVYADPPWDFANEFAQEKKGQTAADHYPTVSTPKICELPINGKALVLFLWVPNAMMMKDGRMVMEEWGFEYKTCMVWVKPRGPSMGWWLRNRHEMLLIGASDDATPPLDRPFSVIEAKVDGHSRKPDVFYDIIEEMYPGPYLELFARRQHDGWTAWGNEINQTGEDSING
jgi:N6-adenosine-specific RNA methylase IME4